MPRSTPRRGSRSCCEGSCPPRPRTCWSGSRPPTTPSSTSSTTSARSSSRVDFFPPLVDDPALFGRIAATNALNDVFAMGGLPLLALSIAAFPESLPNETLAAIFGAADEQVRAAGGILAGGHTLRDDEPKYGLAVVGTVHPNGLLAEERRAARRRALPDEAARDGDAPPRGARRASARGRARGGGGLDDDAQPRGGRRAAPLLPERRHRRDRLRPARPRARDGGAERRPDRARRRGAAALPGRARVRGGRGAHGRRLPQPRLRRPARRGGRRRGGPARARLRPADLGRPPDLAAGRQGRGARRRVRRHETSSSPGSAASSRAPAWRLPSLVRAARRIRDAGRLRAAGLRVRALALPDRAHRRGRAADRLRARVRVVARLPGGRVLPRRRRALDDRVRQPRHGALPDRALARRLDRGDEDARASAAG